MVLYHNQNAKEKDSFLGRGRKRAASPFDGFILCSVRLRRNMSIVHLTYLFDITESTTNNTVITWINFMYMKLRSLPIWPTQEQVQNSMPKSLTKKFPNTRAIIDCVELR